MGEWADAKMERWADRMRGRRQGRGERTDLSARGFAASPPDGLVHGLAGGSVRPGRTLRPVEPRADGPPGWTRGPVDEGSRGGFGDSTDGRTDRRADGSPDPSTDSRIDGSARVRGPAAADPGPTRAILGNSMLVHSLSLSPSDSMLVHSLSLSLSLTQQFNAGSLSLSYSVIQCWFTFSLLLNNSMLVHFPSLTQ